MNIILVFDAINFSVKSFEFAMHQHKQKPCVFTAYFLTPRQHAALFNYSVVPGEEGYLSTPFIDIELISKNIFLFQSLCKKNNIECFVYEKIWSDAVAALVLETRFAELLIIDMESLDRSEMQKKYESCTNLLVQFLECPVVLLPVDFMHPSKPFL